MVALLNRVKNRSSPIIPKGLWKKTALNRRQSYFYFLYKRLSANIN